MLTLGWSKSSHKDKKIDFRQKSGLEVTIKWTPEHADITDKCIADELAKEAAEETKSIP